MTEFDIFKEQCERWIKAFGLTQWEACIAEDALDETNVAARTHARWTQMACKFVWNTRFKDPEDGTRAKGRDPYKIALHEVIHVLLICLVQSVDEAKGPDDNIVIAAEHDIINRMLKVLK